METMCKDCGRVFPDSQMVGALCMECSAKPRRKPILAFDFDGTLVAHDFPRIGAPRIGVIGALKDYHARGYRIIIWTCRDGGYLEEMKAWLDANNVPYDAINDNVSGLPFTTDRKVYYDVLVDDHATSQIGEIGSILASIGVAE